MKHSFSALSDALRYKTNVRELCGFRRDFESVLRAEKADIKLLKEVCLTEDYRRVITLPPGESQPDGQKRTDEERKTRRLDHS